MSVLTDELKRAKRRTTKQIDMSTMTQLVIKLSQEMQGAAWEFPFEDFDMTPTTSQEVDALGDEEIDVWNKWFDSGDVQSKDVTFIPESNALVLHMAMNDSGCTCCIGTRKKFILTPKNK